MQKLLVVGATPGSLGEAIVQAGEDAGYLVTAAGLGEGAHEGRELDVRDNRAVRQLFEEQYIPNVVCTAGVNWQDGNGPFRGVMEQHMEVTIGVVSMIAQWARAHVTHTLKSIPGPLYEGNFVAISSNSARIPRSQSVAYCMSKAALSMGVQGMARKLANTDLSVWCYEPGWIENTPMSERVQRWLPQGGKPHRIVGEERTWQPEALAIRIIQDLHFGRQLNGCCIRLDAGEL